MAKLRYLLSLAIASMMTASCETGIAVPANEVGAPPGFGDGGDDNGDSGPYG